MGAGVVGLVGWFLVRIIISGGKGGMATKKSSKHVAKFLMQVVSWSLTLSYIYKSLCILARLDEDFDC